MMAPWVLLRWLCKNVIGEARAGNLYTRFEGLKSEGVVL